MALSTLFDDTDFDSRNVAPNPVTTAFAAAANAVAAWRADRARRAAMLDLIGMEPHRLRDLGISVHDVRQALEQRRV